MQYIGNVYTNSQGTCHPGIYPHSKPGVMLFLCLVQKIGNKGLCTFPFSFEIAPTGPVFRAFSAHGAVFIELLIVLDIRVKGSFVITRCRYLPAIPFFVDPALRRGRKSQVPHTQAYAVS